ncbi:unnamed protein product [Prunus brigantina]
MRKEPEELRALRRKSIWELVELPEGKKTVTCNLQVRYYDNLIININDNDDVVATKLDYVFSELPNNWAFLVFHSNGLLLLCQLYYWDLYLVNPQQDVGFDHSSGDYKVIMLSYLEGGIMFSVCTLKIGSWRMIQTRYPYKCDLMRHGILLNGGVHWLLDRVAVEHRSDCLCVTHYADGVMHNEYWLMKEYGVRESWTKVRISIPYSVSVLQHSGF